MIAEKETGAGELFQQVSEWVRDEPGWNASSGVVREDPYRRPNFPDVQGLIVTTPGGEKIHLEPLDSEPGGSNAVEMYAWPTLIRVRLLHTSDSAEWKVFTDTGIPLRTGWNKFAFLQLANDLVNAG